ncbi:MAG: ferritin family protein [Candidatus Cloacimonadaceae bacterium]|jgi:rubrerythrin|nr:ferritin family protein [Candidatus Cloacimonadota bacterium]MDY0127578.1 ferritin family protein [Candidatus Cloacimonadaceae bacterium]MCB5255436.1 ferritin family protein [Candidatus Cloacimonadota bacterium]MCK9177891.1 ferritin family protein [Candidatus Cloacimonadota bacterium]MCK9242030.1 ferritin family protein [Candidatus Cloacimonadota bacterium]
MIVYSVNEVIELAVQIEQNGYAFYHEASKRKDLDDESKALIEHLRDEELSHEKTFLALRDDKEMGKLELTQDWELVSKYLKTIVDARIFNSKDAAIQKATNAKDLMEILDFAISFEKDTLLYFHALKDSIDLPSTRKVLGRIINEELSHVLKLTDYRNSLR